MKAILLFFTLFGALSFASNISSSSSSTDGTVPDGIFDTSNEQMGGSLFPNLVNGLKFSEAGSGINYIPSTSGALGVGYGFMDFYIQRRLMFRLWRAGAGDNSSSQIVANANLRPERLATYTLGLQDALWGTAYVNTYVFGQNPNTSYTGRVLFMQHNSNPNVGLGIDYSSVSCRGCEFFLKGYDYNGIEYREFFNIKHDNRATTVSAPAQTGSGVGQTMIFKGADSVNGAAGDAILAGGTASGSGAAGHAYVPRGTGTPPTTPASRTGLAAVKLDDTSGSEKVCFYVNAAWKCASLTAP